MNIYCITWKDERWSANKEDLKEINKMINKEQVRKKSLLSLIDPQAILLFFMYILGFAYHGSTSLLKWFINKLKRNTLIVLMMFAILTSGCESHGWRSVDSCCGDHHHVDHYVDHHHYHHYTPRQIHYHEHVTKQQPKPSRALPPSRPVPPPSRSISKGVPQSSSREPTKKE